MEKSVFKSTEARLDLHDLQNVVNLREKIEKARKQNNLQLVEREDGFALVGSASGLLEFEKSCKSKQESGAKGVDKDIYMESSDGENTNEVHAFLGGSIIGKEKGDSVSNSNMQYDLSKICYIILKERERLVRLLDKSNARIRIREFSGEKVRVRLEKINKSDVDDRLKEISKSTTQAMSELVFPLHECNGTQELMSDVMKINDVRIAILRKDEKTGEWTLYTLVKSTATVTARTKIERLISSKRNKNEEVTDILKALCDEHFRRRSSPQDTTENRIASKPGAIARGSNGALAANKIASTPADVSWDIDDDNEVVETKSKEVIVGDEDIVDYMCHIEKDRLNEIKGDYAVAIEPRNEISMVIKSKRSDVKGAEAALTAFTQEMHRVLRKETIDISKLDSVSLKMRKTQAIEEANSMGYEVGFGKSGELCIVGPSSDMYRCVAKLNSILGLPSGREAAMGNDTCHSQVGVGARPKDNGVMRSPLPPIGSSFPGKMFATRDQRLQVLVWVTDITKLHVDIVVNAANEHLSHGAGVALAIANAAGTELDRECRRYVQSYGEVKVSENCLTTAGRMPSKQVMHAVGPRKVEYRDNKKFDDALYKTFLNCLERAHKNKHESIAVPAISAGIFGGPKEVVAEMAVKAVVHFAKQYPSSSLRFIHFVDILQDTISCIQDKFTRKAIPEFREEKSFDDFDRWLGKTSKGNKTHHRTFEASSSEATATKSGRKEEEDTCSICMDTPTNPKTLPKCKHSFCTACIDECFKRGQPKCPNCGEIYGTIQGTQPKNGKMNITKNRESLPGYRDCGTIQIDYYIPGGIQEECHPNPGQRYEGTQRQAFLPDNKAGNEILQLLRRAFDARMIFTVGRSVTTGRDNCVVWNCIHHKTSPSGKPFGYPDPTYLDRVRDELAAQGFK